MKKSKEQEGKERKDQERRAKKRKGNEAQRVKHPTSSQAIDAHIGDEEHKGNQKNKRLEEY